MIKGEKVKIRVIDLEDINILYKWWTDPKVMDHAGFKYGLQQSYTSHKNNLLNEINDKDLWRTSRRFIILDENDNPIGEVNYGGYSKLSRKCHIGIKICEISEQGKGYGEDVLRHFITYLFDTLNLNKIELDTMIDNKRSQSLYKKLGFKEIGICRASFYDSRTRDYSDSVLFDLLESEWKY
ncbi:GNAT family protein [Mycoplasmatota bacterium WC44]